MAGLESLAIGAGAGVLNKAIDVGASAITGSASAHYARKNFRANADYQNAINIRNARNKYVYELDAMRRAGVNTAMLGGDFSQAGVSAPSGDAGGMPDMRTGPSDLTGAARDVAAAGQAKASEEALLSQARKNDAEAQRLEMTQSVYLRQQFATLYNMSAETQYINSRNDYTETQKQDLLFDLWKKHLTLDQTLENLKLTNEQLRSSIESVNAHTYIDLSKLPLDLRYMTAKIYEAQQQGNLAGVNCRVAYATVDVLQQQARKYMIENNLSEQTFSAQLATALAELGARNMGAKVQETKYAALLNSGKLDKLTDAELSSRIAEALKSAAYDEQRAKYNHIIPFAEALGVCTGAIGNIYKVNVGYNTSQFSGTTTSVNATPVSPLITPRQGGTFDYGQAGSIISPFFNP